MEACGAFPPASISPPAITAHAPPRWTDCGGRYAGHVGDPTKVTALFDPGAQPERTALAWHRTGLTFLASSLVALKIFPPILGTWSVLIGLVGLIYAIVLLLVVRHRYLTHHRILTTSGDALAPVAGGYLIATLTVSTLAAGLVSLAIVLSLHLRG